MSKEVGAGGRFDILLDSEIDLKLLSKSLFTSILELLH